MRLYCSVENTGQEMEEEEERAAELAGKEEGAGRNLICMTEEDRVSLVPPLPPSDLPRFSTSSAL